MRYTNDSTAEDIYRYAYAEPGDAVVREDTKEKRKNEEKKTTALYEIAVKRQNKKIKQSLIVAIAIGFILAGILVVRYASIYEIHYRTARIDSQINALTIENSRLEAVISSNSNVVDIDSVAQNELGMQKPQPYQIVPINVEPVDELKMTNNLKLSSTTDDLAWYEEIIQGIKNFFGFIDYE